MILALLISLPTFLPPLPAIASKGVLELRSPVEGSSFICIGAVDEVRTVTVPAEVSDSLALAAFDGPRRG